MRRKRLIFLAHTGGISPLWHIINKCLFWLVLTLGVEITALGQVIYTNGDGTFGPFKGTNLKTTYPGGALVVDPITGELLTKSSTSGTATETYTQTNIYNRLANLISTNSQSLYALSNEVVLLKNQVVTGISATNFPLLVCGTTFTGTVGTSAYASGDVICDGNNSLVPPFTLTNVVFSNGQGGDICKVRLMVSNNAWTPAIRIYFFNSTNVTWYSNTMDYTAMFTNNAARAGYIDLPAMSTETVSSDCSFTLNISDALPFKCAASDKNIYCYIVAKGAATPVASQPYYLEVMTKPR